MVHRPNKQKRDRKLEDWFKRMARRDDLRHIVLNWSWRDGLNGEIVFEEKKVPLIRKKLKEHEEDQGEWMWCLNHEFGEVLNNKVFYHVW